MAAADRKITYTAAEVAELIRPLTQSVEALQKENTELKRKLEHMNEILANAQRARFGQSSEKKAYVLSEDQMSLFNEAEICQDSKADEFRNFRGSICNFPVCCGHEFSSQKQL